MKLSFSTRGWKNLSWEEIKSLAVEMHFSGIEIYSMKDFSSFCDKSGPFNEYTATASIRNLREKKLSIPCLDTMIELADENAIQDLSWYASKAVAMKVPYISAVARTGSLEDIKKGISAFLKASGSEDIALLIKTNGIFSNSEILRDVLDEFTSDKLAVLWDVHHTYFDNKESADTTIKNLGAYVKHVHMRDSDDEGNYTVIGEGSLPVSDMLRALSSIDYDGFVSLEWRPQEREDENDYEYILPHYVNYMTGFERSSGDDRGLQKNHDGSGYYVWKKDELIRMTFSQVLDRMVEAFPDQYAFKYTTLDYTRTYSEFRDDVDRFARALVSLGVKAGSKVSVWATNVPEWFIAFWATVKIGAVLVSVNTAYKIHEAEYLFRQSDTHTLVMIESCLDSNYKEIINELCPEIKDTVPGQALRCKRLPFLRNVISVGFKMDGCLTFEEAMDRAKMVPADEIRRMASAVDPDDVCNMQYTSGTTGFPKGVMLTHYNVVNNGKCIGDRMGLSTADRMMIQVPMFHCFGMVLSMTASLTHGTTICPLPYFSAKNSLACINQEKITCFNGVPTMFIAMFNHPDYRNTDFSHMRTGIMAGAGCPPELMRKAALPEEMNMKGIVSVYGQTESAPGSTMSAWTDTIEVRTDTVGYAFPFVECKIIDPETGEELPAGANGEFCSRGYNTMKGYYKMPAATKLTVDKDGWLHSGDIAMRDEDGNYKITGRLKDMIIRGGENIYPKEIEEFIYTHPFVQDVQVIGVPDEKYGEEAMACIILKEGKEVSEAEMREFITDRLARHKVPKYIEFVSSFPMNAAGKVLKYKMREDAIERLKCHK